MRPVGTTTDILSETLPSGIAAIAMNRLDDVERAVTSPDVRAIVLTVERDDTRQHGSHLPVCEALVRAPKPVIAGINGAATGAGADIACAADYRLATSSARIGSGLIVARVIGPARATEIFLTDRLVGAAEAEHIGLFDRVVPDEAFARELAACAECLAGKPTELIGLFKEFRERTWGQPVEFGPLPQGEPR